MGLNENPPSMAFERDAPKAARPSTLRYASVHAPRVGKTCTDLFGEGG